MSKEQKYSFHAMFRGYILIGFFLLVFKLMVTGDIRYFLAPKMVPFSYFTIFIMFILGVLQVWRSGSDRIEDLYCNCGFDHGQNSSFVQILFIYLLFFLPILSGLLFPNTVLDSSVVAKRGVNYGTGSYSNPENKGQYSSNISLVDDENDQNKNAELIPGEENAKESIFTSPEQEKLKEELLQNNKIIVDDELYLATLDILHSNPNLFLGKEVEIMGFVYKESDFKENQLAIARFSISCCVADALVYGLFSTMENAQGLKEDEWVKVTGTLSVTQMYGQELPYLQISHAERIEQPEDPYVYESLIPLVE